MQHIGIFANPGNASALDAVKSIIQSAGAASFTCAVDSSLKELSSFAKIPSFQQEPPEVILALGGDGTILRAAALALSLGVPVVGINFGRVGFMSGISAQEVPLALDRDVYKRQA